MQKLKRAFSLFVALVMCMSVMSLPAFAEGEIVSDDLTVFTESAEDTEDAAPAETESAEDTEDAKQAETAPEEGTEDAEEAETAPEEDEAARRWPAKDFTDYRAVAGYTVTVAVEPESFAEEVQLRVMALGWNIIDEATRELLLASGLTEDDALLDIAFVNADGVEIEPLKPVAVTIEAEEAEIAEVYHVEDEETVTLVAEDVAEFEVGGFSLFVVKAGDLTDAEAALLAGKTYTKYATLAEAVEAVPEGTTEATVIKLLANIEEATDMNNKNTPVATIPSGKNVTLDLNGHSIQVEKLTRTAKSGITMVVSRTAIQNYGVFTLTDGDGAGTVTGRLVNGATGPAQDGHPRMTIKGGTLTYDAGKAVIVNNPASALIVDGGVIRMESETGNVACLYNDKTATTEINGGTFVSGSSDCGAVYNAGTMTINDATITGAHRALDADNGSLTINGGSFESTYQGESTGAYGHFCLFITNYGAEAEVEINNGTFTGGAYGVYEYPYTGASSAASIEINGGTFTGSTTAAVYSAAEEAYRALTITGGTYSSNPNEYVNTAKAKTFDNGDGTWTVGPVAKIDTEPYGSLAEAIAHVPALASGETATAENATTITMLADETIVGNTGVTVAAGKNVVLDLNGWTVKQTVPNAAASAFITNQGTLTIQDSSSMGNGKLIADANGVTVGSSRFIYGNYTIENNGTLYVTSGTVECNLGGGACYAIDNNSSAASAVTTISGGLVKSDRVAMRMFCNSTTFENALTMTGGTVYGVGSTGLWVQLPGSDATKAMKATLDISGGTMKTDREDGNAFYDYSYGNPYTNVQYNLSGGTFVGGIFSYGANIAISGGTYETEVDVKQTDPSTLSVTGGVFKDGFYDSGASASEKFITGGTFVYHEWEGGRREYTYSASYYSMSLDALIEWANSSGFTSVTDDGNDIVTCVYEWSAGNSIDDYGDWIAPNHTTIRTSLDGTYEENGNYFTVVPERTVTWVVNGTETTETVGEGATPVYSGEAPAKAADAQYTYTFSGWTPEITAVTADATYTATFAETARVYTPVEAKDPTCTEPGNSAYWVRQDDDKFFSDAEGANEITLADAEIAALSHNYVAVVTDPTCTEQGYTTHTCSRCGDSYVDGYVDALGHAWGEPVWNWTGYSAATATFTCARDATHVEIVNASITRDDSDPAQYVYTATVEHDRHAYTDTQSETRTYTVTWVVNGTQTSETLAYGATPSHTVNGYETAEYTYTFSGWEPAITTVIGDATYTAQFSNVKKTYSVTWVIDGVSSTANYEYGATPSHDAPTKAATAQYTYTFSGWEPTIEAVTADATYTATYSSTVNQYKIEWRNNDGTLIDTTTVEYGATPSHDAPTKAATDSTVYTFSGWTPTIEAVTGPQTYTATFAETAREYTITFVDEDGTVLQSGNVAYGTTPAYSGETPIKAATDSTVYTFSGWTPEIVAVTGDATYTATFAETAREYTITFVNEDGTELQSSAVAYGTTPAYSGETPTKAATAQYTYTFSGWEPTIEAVTGDATYTAQFTATVNKYTVRFLDDDGTELQSSAVAYGRVPTAPANPTKASDGANQYTFAGWDKAIVKVTGDATYKATYTSSRITYTITFVDSDGTVLKAATVASGTTPEYTGETPTKADVVSGDTRYKFTFSAWSPKIGPATGNATYTATYTVTEIVNETEKDLGVGTVDTGTQTEETDDGTKTTTTTTISLGETTLTETVEKATTATTEENDVSGTVNSMVKATETAKLDVTAGGETTSTTTVTETTSTETYSKTSKTVESVETPVETITYTVETKTETKTADTSAIESAAATVESVSTTRVELVPTEKKATAADTADKTVVSLETVKNTIETDKVDVAAIVSDVLEKYEDSAAKQIDESTKTTETKIEIQLELRAELKETTKAEESSEVTSVTYDVKPYAKVIDAVSGATLEEDVRVENAQLSEDVKNAGEEEHEAKITIKLPIPATFVPENYVEGTTTIEIKHIADDGTLKGYITGTIYGNAEGGYYVEFTVTEFSSFEIVPAEKVFVTFVLGNGSDADARTYTKGDTITAPTPTRSGWTFAGWDVAVPATALASATYTAQWLPISSDGYIPALTPQETTIEDEETPLSEFPIFYVDVAEDSWYHDAIAYVTALAVMGGVGGDKFAPNDNTTRGMVATVMMRLASGEAVDLDSFFDVADDAYYAEAAAWAVENGVFVGYEDGSFRGETLITREQFAAVLYRYAVTMGYAVSGKASLDAYDDGTLVSGYATEAMAWAVENGIIRGIGGNKLDPTGSATRAQLATMLMRFDELIQDNV